MIELIAVALSIIDKTLDHIPNYDQRKKEKYYRLKKEYSDAITAEIIDDNNVIKLELELRHFLETFSSELSTQNKNLFV